MGCLFQFSLFHWAFRSLSAHFWHFSQNLCRLLLPRNDFPQRSQVRAGLCILKEMGRGCGFPAWPGVSASFAFRSTAKVDRKVDRIVQTEHMTTRSGSTFARSIRPHRGHSISLDAMNDGVRFFIPFSSSRFYRALIGLTGFFSGFFPSIFPVFY